MLKFFNTNKMFGKEIINTPQNKGYLQKATFDNDLLPEEDVDNINNDNEGDDHVGETSSDNGEIER